jgi:hypothetical protein
MNTITIGRTTYKLRDTSTIFADHAKCTGKHKIVKSKGAEKRLYPPQGASMSTADYVRAYESMNNKIIPWDWQALTEHVSQPQGEDTFEVEA